MALEFYKRRFRIPSKRTQYILAFTALLLALALVFCWITIRHNLDEMNNSSVPEDSSSATNSPVYTAEDDGHLLLIVTDEDSARFFLLRSSPANRCVDVTAIPEQAITANGLTLTSLYQKHGATYIVSRLATITERPVRHYATITAENAEKWFSRLGGELLFTLDAAVTVTDENGASTILSVGDKTLTAAQATAILCQPSMPDKLRAEIIAEMLKQHLHSGRNLAADFSYLANIARTSLRIGDFTEYRDKLAYLAEQNQHGTCAITAHIYDK